MTNGETLRVSRKGGHGRGKRRGRDEGSIYHRASDDRWVGSVHLGYVDGKRVRKTVYGRTRTEAAEKLRKIQTELDRGTYVHDDQQTTEAYLQWWLTNVLNGTVKDKTADGYRYMIEHYIVPSIGSVKLAKLSPLDVQGLLTGLENRNLSAATRRQVRAILRRALTHAERFELVHRNAAALTEAPRGVTHRIDDALDLDEARRLLNAVEGHPLEALVTVALCLGLRKGEILALKWSNVDLVIGTLTVSATLSRRTGHGLVETEPKTERSRRTVPLPEVCIRVLKEHRLSQLETRLAAGDAWADGDYIFTTPIGTPIDPRNLTTDFHALTEKAGLGRRRFHALRHSAASLMLAQDVPLSTISTILGHASYAITADVYARVDDSLKQRAALAMDAALG